MNLLRNLKRSHQHAIIHSEKVVINTIKTENARIQNELIEMRQKLNEVKSGNLDIKAEREKELREQIERRAQDIFAKNFTEKS